MTTIGDRSRLDRRISLRVNNAFGHPRNSSPVNRRSGALLAGFSLLLAGTALTPLPALADNLLVGAGGNGGFNGGVTSGGGGGIGGGGGGGGWSTSGAGISGTGGGGGITYDAGGGGALGGAGGYGYFAFESGGSAGVGGGAGANGSGLGGGAGGLFGGAGAVSTGGGGGGGAVVDVDGINRSGFISREGATAPSSGTISTNQTYEFVGVGGGGGGAGDGGVGHAGSGGNLIVNGAALSVDRSILIGGAGGGASAGRNGGAGGTGIATLNNGSALSVAETLQIGGLGASGALSGVAAGGAGGNGTLSIDTTSSVTIGSGGSLILGGIAGAHGPLSPGGAAGSGVLNLGGSLNLASGATFAINGNGTLNFGNATPGAAQAGPVSGLASLANAGVLNFNQSNASYSFAPAITGTGSVIQNGPGITILGGASTYTGATSVNAGTLVVNGSIASSSGLAVAAGGTVGGIGTLPSTVIQSGAMIAPGNSPGTLTIAGDLTLNAGSTYIAEVQGGLADRISVIAGNGQTGAASLDGTLRIVPLGGSYNFSTPYTLLSAAGGRTGTFSTVDTTGSFGAGVTSAVSYTASDVRLTLTAAPLTPIVTTPVQPSLPSPQFSVSSPANVAGIASALDRFVGAGGDVSAFFNLYNLPAGAIGSAVNQLSGEAHTGTSAAGNFVATQFLGTTLDSSLPGRLDTPQQPGPGAAAFTSHVSKGHDLPAKPAFLDQPRFALWGAASGSAGRVDGSASAGSARRNLDDAHLTIGADVRIMPNTIAGVAVSAGKARSSLAGGLGKVEADVFQAGLYGMTRIGALNLSAAGSYGRLDNEGTRAVPVLGNALTSSYVSTVWSGRVQASAAIANWGGMSFSPLAALQAVHVRSPAFTEHAGFGGNAGALSVARRNDNTSRSELGVQLDAQAMFGAVPVTGFVRASWAHYFARDAAMTASFAALPGVSFSASGARPDANSALIAAGLDARLSERVSLGVRLDSELSVNTRSIGGTAQLKVSF